MPRWPANGLQTLPLRRWWRRMAGNECEDASCVAQIGGALGTGLVLHGTMGNIGSSYAITLGVVNTATAQARVRLTKTLPRDEDALIKALPSLASTLVRKLNAQ